MSWWKKLVGIAGVAAAPFTGGLSLAASGLVNMIPDKKGGNSGSAPKDPNQALLDIINPTLTRFNDTSVSLAAQGKEDLGAARGEYSNLLKYFQRQMSGDREALLADVDASGITKSYDDAERMLAQFGTRGGRSAERLSNLGYERAGEINRFVQVLRKEAPEKRLQIAQAMAQMGLNEYNLSSEAGRNFINTYLKLKEMQDAKEMSEEDQKAEMIGSIIGAAGSVAGAVIARGGGS